MASKVFRIDIPAASQTVRLPIIEDENLFSVIDITSLRLSLTTLNVVVVGNVMPWITATLTTGALGLLNPDSPGYLGSITLQPRNSEFVGANYFYQYDYFATRTLPETRRCVSPVDATVEVNAAIGQIPFVFLQVFWTERNVTAAEYVRLKSGGF